MYEYENILLLVHCYCYLGPYHDNDSTRRCRSISIKDANTYFVHLFRDFSINSGALVSNRRSVIRPRDKPLTRSIVILPRKYVCFISRDGRFRSMVAIHDIAPGRSRRSNSIYFRVLGEAVVFIISKFGRHVMKFESTAMPLTSYLFYL